MTEVGLKVRPVQGADWPSFADHRTTNPETAPGGAFDIYTVDVR